MEKFILILKILITEQKVKFYNTICYICEKIELHLRQHY